MKLKDNQILKCIKLFDEAIGNQIEIMRSDGYQKKSDLIDQIEHLKHLIQEKEVENTTQKNKQQESLKNQIYEKQSEIEQLQQIKDQNDALHKQFDNFEQQFSLLPDIKQLESSYQSFVTSALNQFQQEAETTSQKIQNLLSVMKKQQKYEQAVDILKQLGKTIYGNENVLIDQDYLKYTTQSVKAIKKRCFLILDQLNRKFQNCFSERKAMIEKTKERDQLKQEKSQKTKEFESITHFLTKESNVDPGVIQHYSELPLSDKELLISKMKQIIQDARCEQ